MMLEAEEPGQQQEEAEELQHQQEEEEERSEQNKALSQETPVVDPPPPKKTKRRPTCRVDGCGNRSIKWGVCVRHGAPPTPQICRHPGCTNVKVTRGVCIRHGARVRICRVEGCTNQVQLSGVCIRHGAKRKPPSKCLVAGCTNNARSGGRCWTHGSREIERAGRRKSDPARKRARMAPSKHSPKQGKGVPREGLEGDGICVPAVPAPQCIEPTNRQQSTPPGNGMTREQIMHTINLQRQMIAEKDRYIETMNKLHAQMIEEKDSQILHMRNTIDTITRLQVRETESKGNEVEDMGQEKKNLENKPKKQNHDEG